MANEKRSRTDLVAGALSAGITTSDTTISSAGLADLGVIDSTNHAAVTLFSADDSGRVTTKEIVYVTAHSAAATSATVVRAREGTTAQTWPIESTWAHTATAKDFDGAGGGSGLIGFTSYNPGVTLSVAATSSSFVDVDATNLVVAFTAPPSGKVLVSFTGFATITTIGNVLAWNARDSLGDVTGTRSAVLYYTVSGATAPDWEVRVSHRFSVSGLTPGTAYSYKWGHARTSGSGGVTTSCGGTIGPAVMEVWAVNL